MADVQTQGAAVAVVVPDDLIVLTIGPGLSELAGTRAMLEAEGVIPDGLKWPNGYDDLRWQDGNGTYRLRRVRPDGTKGPRKLFADVDWWRFRWEPAGSIGFIGLEIKRREREVADFAYRQTEEGRAEMFRQADAYSKSKNDAKFQALKSLIPGWIPPARGRRPGCGSTSQGGGSMMARKLHGLEELPEGKTVGDVIPAFAGVTREVRIGGSSKVCASCHKPFSPVRKARKEIRLYPMDAKTPFAWFYPVCGACALAYQEGGGKREVVLAAVEAFHYRNEVKQ